MKIVRFTDLHTYPPGTLFRVYHPINHDRKPSWGDYLVLENPEGVLSTETVIYYRNLSTPSLIHDFRRVDSVDMVSLLSKWVDVDTCIIKPADEQVEIRHDYNEYSKWDSAQDAHAAAGTAFAVYDKEDVDCLVDIIKLLTERAYPEPTDASS